MLYTSSRAGQQSQRLRNWAKSVQHMENVQVSCFTHSIIIELQVDFHYLPKYRSIMCAALLSCVLLYKVFSMISRPEGVLQIHTVSVQAMLNKVFFSFVDSDSFYI